MDHKSKSGWLVFIDHAVHRGPSLLSLSPAPLRCAAPMLVPEAMSWSTYVIRTPAILVICTFVGSKLGENPPGHQVWSVHAQAPDTVRPHTEAGAGRVTHDVPTTCAFQGSGDPITLSYFTTWWWSNNWMFPFILLTVCPWWRWGKR